MKKFMFAILVLALVCVLFAGCTNPEVQAAADERMNDSLDEIEERLDAERENEAVAAEQALEDKYGSYTIEELDEILNTIEDSDEWLELYDYIEERKEIQESFSTPTPTNSYVEDKQQAAEDAKEDFVDALGNALLD